MYTHVFPYEGRALFSIRSSSSFIFSSYSRILISQTFFMMEAPQPTTSGFLSLDIFKLFQTPCTQRETDHLKKVLDLYFDSVLNAINISHILQRSRSCTLSGDNLSDQGGDTANSSAAIYTVSLGVINLLLDI